MPPRFTLWHSRDTRSLRILWTFEELGLRRGRDYALRVLTFPPRVHHPEFLATNRLGTVPFFEHREQWDAAPRAAMSESCAVPLYLADLHRSPLALQEGAAFARVHDLLVASAHVLTKRVREVVTDVYDGDAVRAQA